MTDVVKAIEVIENAFATCSDVSHIVCIPERAKSVQNEQIMKGKARGNCHKSRAPCLEAHKRNARQSLVMALGLQLFSAGVMPEDRSS